MALTLHYNAHKSGVNNTIDHTTLSNIKNTRQTNISIVNSCKTSPFCLTFSAIMQWNTLPSTFWFNNNNKSQIFCTQIHITIAYYTTTILFNAFILLLLHECMADVWIDAKSLRPCICMHFRRTLYWWGHHIMVQFEYGFKVIFVVRPVWTIFDCSWLGRDWCLRAVACFHYKSLDY